MILILLLCTKEPKNNYRPQKKFAKVMFSQVFVCQRWGGSRSRGFCPSVRGGFCPGGFLSRGYPSKESLYRGVSVQEGLCPGGLCPGGLCPGGSLSRGVSVWGVSVQGVSVQGLSVQGVSVQGASVLLSRGFLSWGYPSKGSLSRRVSVQGVSVRGSLLGRPPKWLNGGSTHPTGMHSC